MKTFLLLVACFVVQSGFAHARAIAEISDQEQFAKADLVVIARLVSTKNTFERRLLPGMEYHKLRVIGANARMETSLVLKGPKTTKNLVVHYYRLGPEFQILVNGPGLLRFPEKAAESGPYLLFLVRERDGRYAPVAGQVDPLMSVWELGWLPRGLQTP